MISFFSFSRGPPAPAPAAAPAPAPAPAPVPAPAPAPPVAYGRTQAGPSGWGRGPVSAGSQPALRANLRLHHVSPPPAYAHTCQVETTNSFFTNKRRRPSPRLTLMVVLKVELYARNTIACKGRCFAPGFTNMFSRMMQLCGAKEYRLFGVTWTCTTCRIRANLGISRFVHQSCVKNVHVHVHDVCVCICTCATLCTTSMTCTSSGSSHSTCTAVYTVNRSPPPPLCGRRPGSQGETAADAGRTWTGRGRGPRPYFVAWVASYGLQPPSRSQIAQGPPQSPTHLRGTARTGSPHTPPAAGPEALCGLPGRRGFLMGWRGRGAGMSCSSRPPDQRPPSSPHPACTSLHPAFDYMVYHPN
eukprot:gene8104-biopygen7599